jgi:hypothetical protein
MLYQQKKYLPIPSLLIKFWDFDKELTERRPKKRVHDSFLHLNKVPTHLPDNDFNRLGIRRLSYLPYNPDLALCDFWLFGTLENKL